MDSFWPALLLSLLAAGALALATMADLPLGWSYFLVGICLISGVFAFFQLASWVVYTWNQNYSTYVESRARTEAVVFVETCSRLTHPWQAEVVKSQPTIVNVLPGTPGPTYTAQIGMVQIPLDFLEGFLLQCNETQLYPVRNYSDSIQREYAQAITNWCFTMRLADSAIGNQPATWKKDGYRDAKIFWGVEV